MILDPGCSSSHASPMPDAKITNRIVLSCTGCMGAENKLRVGIDCHGYCPNSATAVWVRFTYIHICIHIQIIKTDAGLGQYPRRV